MILNHQGDVNPYLYNYIYINDYFGNVSKYNNKTSETIPIATV